MRHLPPIIPFFHSFLTFFLSFFLSSLLLLVSIFKGISSVIPPSGTFTVPLSSASTHGRKFKVSRASYVDTNRKSYDSETNQNLDLQNFLKPTRQLVDPKGIQREGEMEMKKARNVPRDGRIAACGTFFAVVGCDGAVRLYDTEASLGIAFL